MTTVGHPKLQLLARNCDGGHYTCSPPKECCKQGCCYLLTTSVYRPPALPSSTLLNPLFLGHWYFWLAVTATVAGILCACSLWRRHSQAGGLCCRPTRAHRPSEPDSSGSCCAPPQYSRCNSFHQPPPYSEVASKPDLYPLVITRCDAVGKHAGASTGYLMVQYFRNFIVRPTLSATSTIDSLSSSFICNAANEANTVVPPPYESAGSLCAEAEAMPRSVSLLSAEFEGGASPASRPASRGAVVSIRDNPCFGQQEEEAGAAATVLVPNHLEDVVVVAAARVEDVSKCQSYCDASSPLKRIKRSFGVYTKLPKERSQDSELSQDEDPNFSDLLNLSVCMPSSVAMLGTPLQSSHLHELQFSVPTSMTGSDISSLANLGTPDSPPRATSPTLEMRELLDKIQRLPLQRSPAPPARPPARAKARPALYVPLQEGGGRAARLRGWLSRSAPSTPCGAGAPAFPAHRKGSSQRGSRVAVGEGSERLLREHEEAEEEGAREEC